MRYGFKTRAERMSGEAREELGIGPADPLDLARYAALRGIIVLAFDELELSDAARTRLLQEDPDSWSGMTIKIGKAAGIVVNPVHPSGRRNYTLAHEVSHVVLGHVPASANLSKTGMLLLTDYQEEDEAEADWLAGALLLPRGGLMAKRAAGVDVDSIAAAYGASRALTEWRLRMTGVDTQLARTRRS